MISKRMTAATAAASVVVLGWMLSAAADEEQDVGQTIIALESTVGDLQRRIQLLEDVDAIENLVAVYGYYLDKQQWDQLADIFAEDGTMEISQRGVYVGKASIRKALELFGPQNIEPNRVHNHMQLQPVIHVAPDGKTAWVRNRAFSQLGSYGGTARGGWMGGVYENEFVKENGVWKMKKDHVYTTYFANYDKGWAHGAGPAPKPSSKIPPDRPTTEVYEAFPDVYIPPFHYKHPVTGTDIDAKLVEPLAPRNNKEEDKKEGARE